MVLLSQVFDFVLSVCDSCFNSSVQITAPHLLSQVLDFVLSVCGLERGLNSIGEFSYGISTACSPFILFYLSVESLRAQWFNYIRRRTLNIISCVPHYNKRSLEKSLWHIDTLTHWLSGVVVTSVGFCFEHMWFMLQLPICCHKCSKCHKDPYRGNHWLGNNVHTLFVFHFCMSHSWCSPHFLHSRCSPHFLHSLHVFLIVLFSSRFSPNHSRRKVLPPWHQSKKPSHLLTMTSLCSRKKAHGWART